MAQEPVYERTVELPLDYVVTLRATPSTVRRTLLRLLPWALVAMTPGSGRRAKLVLAAARRVSPLVRLRLR